MGAERLTLGVSMHEHIVDMTLAAWVWAFDHAEALGSVLVVVVCLVVVWVDLLAACVVLLVFWAVLLVVAVDEAARFAFAVVQATG